MANNQNKYAGLESLRVFLTNIRNTFSQIGHKHTKSEITDFAHDHNDIYYTETEIDTKLNNKADASHTHSISNVTNLQTELNSKVSTSRTINGKSLAENITLSASDVGADASGSASSALSSAKTYTDQKVAALVNGAPETLNTLDELAAALKDNADIVDVLNEAIGSKASQTDLEALESELDSYEEITSTEVQNLFA